MANLLSAHRDLGQPRASRRGRARCGAWPTCRRRRARRRSRCSRPPPTARSRRCGSPAPTRRSRCPTRRRCAGRSSAASSSWCRKPSPPPPPAPTPTCCCRPRPGARRTAPSPTASAASAACAPAVAAPGEARARLGDRGRLRAPARSAAAPRRTRRRPRCSPTPDAEAVWNEHRESTRGRDLDITGLSYALLEQPRRSNGRCPKAQPRARRACTRTASSPPPTAARASSTRRTRRRPSRATRAIPFALTTGRLRDQWHGMSRTGTLGRLFGHAPRAGRARCIRRTWRASAWHDGDLVHVTSRRGSIVLPAQRQRRAWRRRRPSSRCTGARSSLGRRARQRAARSPASTR